MTVASTPKVLHKPRSAAHLSDEQIAEFGHRLDAIRDEVISDRGAQDAAYVRRLIATQRVLEVSGRALLLAAKHPVAGIVGTGMMSLAKILENMEIGHNVIHGQWDWMNDPDIHSTTWEWDMVGPASAWRHTHNDLHHTWTNVLGKDEDVGYNLLRVSDDQPWSTKAAFNVPLNVILATFFEWGIGIYGLELVSVAEGTKSKEELSHDLKEFAAKASRQLAKDYVATPLLAQALTGSGKAALIGTFAANTVRNLWSHAVIFCGHFPDGIETFSPDVVEGETRGGWYLRQVAGSGNIKGGPFMHLMTGNLSYQIEHHLFPDLPSNRYAQVAPKVKALCAEYGLPYVDGPLTRQVAQTWRKIARLSFPDERRPRIFGRRRKSVGA